MRWRCAARRHGVGGIQRFDFLANARTCSSLACAFITTSMCLPRTISLAFAAELGKQRAATYGRTHGRTNAFAPRGLGLFIIAASSLSLFTGKDTHWHSTKTSTKSRRTEKIESLAIRRIAQVRLHAYRGADSGRVQRADAEALESARVTVRVAGRIMAIRLMGKAGFAHLQQDGQRLRSTSKKTRSAMPDTNCGSCSTWRSHRSARISVSHPHRRVEYSCGRTDIFGEGPAALPEKFHGLTDVELRYRQRYLDLVMNPEVREVFLKRSKLVQSLRRYFDGKASWKSRRR